METKEYLDKVIKELWLNEIKKDYDNHHLLLEDSVKCSFYYHLRNRLSNGWLTRHRIRIFPEFHLSRGRRADIAIVRIAKKNDRTGYHLSNCIESVLSIIEIKHKAAPITNPFYEDRKKLLSYSVDYPECQLYAAFIHEEFYNENNSSWFDKRQTNTWAKGRVSELLGYWDEDTNEFVTAIKSYNEMNPSF